MGQYYGSETVDSISCGNGAGMYQFFVDEQQVQQGQIVITGQDVNHIGNVLRMKPGEKVRISDSNEHSYFCRITEITEDEVIAAIEEKDELGTEFAHKVYLFQGLPKSDKLELIIQKAVELGVYEVVPVAMKNCVVKLDQKKALNKQKRWQAIAESAAKQSKRTVIPQVQIAAVDGNMHRISLGRRILRTETAGLATLSMLIYELDM